jgi:putative hydrolase of the HAD superfamily
MVTVAKRVVFWDFDGTLGIGPHGAGKWAPCFIEALDELHPRHGFVADDVRRFTRGTYPWHKHETPHPELDSAEKWWAPLESLFARAFEGLGFADSAADLARATRRYYADGSRWGLYDDTMPALGRLRSEGWRNVILSNNIPELEANVAQLGLADLIDAVVCSAVIGYEKPHPEAYRCALAATGKLAVRWMVGDSFTADVQGAEEVGIPAILVRRTHPEASRAAIDLNGAVDLILAETRHA